MPDPDEVQLPGTRGPAQYFVEYVKGQLIPYYGSGEVFGGGLRVTTSIDLAPAAARQGRDRQVADGEGRPVGRARRDRSARRARARDGRRLELLQEPVQPRRPGRAPAGLRLQAVRARDGARARASRPSNTFISRQDDDQPRRPALDGAELRGRATSGRSTCARRRSTRTTRCTPSSRRSSARATSRDMARELGIQSPLNNYFAIGLGAEAVNPLEMARAFASLANDGKRIDGALLGEPAARRPEGRGRRRGRPQRAGAAAYPARRARRRHDHVDPRGRRRGSAPASAPRSTTAPAAGKTGTTENYGDAWFVGYTPQLVTAVWVGYDDRFKPMEREFDGKPVAGGTYPALIWKTFMQSALDQLGEPAGVVHGARPRRPPRSSTWRSARAGGAWTTATAATRASSRSTPTASRPRPRAASRTRCGCRASSARTVGRGAGSAGQRPAPVGGDHQAGEGRRGARRRDRPDPRAGTLSAGDTVRLVVAEVAARQRCRTSSACGSRRRASSSRSSELDAIARRLPERGARDRAGPGAAAGGRPRPRT